ncbi:hypothetical protein NUW58_g978 [Xylaria curta]|uniref:Uncharacterized protein n=1 Tax=Xylaria curta TaxID=42375 RepID=A0ACC1PQ60_9PEZI|nr:hypothetical protein NUW58_g978 [Xylaria curta]
MADGGGRTFGGFTCAFQLHAPYIVDSSSHFFWSTGSPRSLVSATLLPADKLFAPIADGFTSYDSSLYTVIHGTAKSRDVGGRTVTIKLADGEDTRTLPYYALVLATGVRTPSPATSLHGNYTITKAAIADLNKKLASATSVIVSGGEPINHFESLESKAHWNVCVLMCLRDGIVADRSTGVAQTGNDSVCKYVVLSFG